MYSKSKPSDVKHSKFDMRTSVITQIPYLHPLRAQFTPPVCHVQHSLRLQWGILQYHGGSIQSNPLWLNVFQESITSGEGIALGLKNRQLRPSLLQQLSRCWLIPQSFIYTDLSLSNELEKRTVVQLDIKCPAFYRTPKFIALLKRATSCSAP